MVDSETNLMAYVSTDEDLVTRKTVTEDTMMTEIRDVVQAVEDAATEGEDDDDDDEPEPPPTLREALAILKNCSISWNARAVLILLIYGIWNISSQN